jgi:hypothetical protein
VTKWGE